MNRLRDMARARFVSAVVRMRVCVPGGTRNTLGPMKSSRTPERIASQPLVDDLIRIAEDFVVPNDPAGLMRELLFTGALTLRNPAGILAAHSRLLWGAGAARLAP